MAKRDNRRFAGGQLGGNGVYECQACHKKTRETGEGESSCYLCAYCFMAFGVQNSYYDGVIDAAQYEKSIADLMKQYKRTDRVVEESDGVAGHKKTFAPEPTTTWGEKI